MASADIDEVLARMDALLARAVDADDPRGYFTCVYRAVTARVRDDLAAGVFAGSQRMHDLDVVFADRYLDAHDAHDRGETVTGSWQVAFDHADSPLLVLQHVLLGMNAHINLDLGIAAAQVAPGDAIHELAADFAAINTLLASEVDRMQDALAVVSPWTGLVDRIGGRSDELVATWSINRARDSAWRLALELAALQDPAPRIAQRDRGVAEIGVLVADPGPPTSWAVTLARWRERSDVAGFADLLAEAGAPVAP